MGAETLTPPEAPAKPAAPPAAKAHPFMPDTTRPEPETPKDAKTEDLLQINDKLKAVFRDRLKGKEATLKKEDMEPAKPEEPKDKKEEPKKEEPAKEPKAKADEPEKAKTEEPKKEEPEKPPEKPKPTKVSRKSDPAVEAAKQAAEAAKAAVELARQSREPVKQKPEEIEKADREKLLAQLPEGYRADLPVLEVMEKRQPEKYKNLTRRYAEAALRTQAYQKQWEEANPEAAFNPEDSAHDKFFATNGVDWDERDYGRALAYMEVEPLLQEEQKRSRKFQEELTTKEEIREAEPKIKIRQGEEAKALIKELSEESLSLVNDHGQVVETEFNKLDEKFPVQTDILARAATDLGKFVDQVERIFHPKQVFAFDEKNPAHIAIAEYVLGKEQQILGLPEEQQLDGDGRQFVTRRQYAEMSKAEKAHHWQLEARDIALLRRQEITEFVKEAIEKGRQRVETVAARLGFVKAPDPKVAQQTPPPEPAKTAPAIEKPSGPSGGGEPKTDTLQKSASPETTDWRTELKNRLRGVSVK